MSELPGGTVTFLFTDIEGSTQRWEADASAMRVDLLRHDALLRDAISRNGGRVFKTVGDAFCAAFPSARSGLCAAIDAQRLLREANWVTGDELRVRMAVHTGEAEERDSDYFGPALNRVSRLLSAGHGGQILVADASQSLLREDLPPGVELLDLGRHRLKDLNEPERIFQVIASGLETDFPALRTIDARPNNLPVEVTSFIGREREIDEVKRLLTDSRLLTLIGPGGIGKTRIALRVSADVLDQYPDGVWLIELAPLSDPRLIPQTVASILKIKERPGEPILDTLLESLEHRRLLILLDNCEQLIDACARFAEAILTTTPNVAILATSREPLGVSGEVRWTVPSLPVPEADLSDSSDQVDWSDAVRLFVDRARALRPEFSLTSENVRAVAEIVRHLDGLPLAIELAASRITVLSPREIADRLDDRFRLLKGGNRTAVPRQQALRALIDWSYDLLSDAERTLFNRVTVFAGGFTLDAAEQVASDDEIEPIDVLDLLTQLVEKSLVFAGERDGHRRYGLLETLRAYGRDRLSESGEFTAVWRAFVSYVLSIAEQAATRLSSEGYRQWLDRCEVELDNLRAVMEWSRTHDVETGLRIAAALRQFWWLKGYVHEGRMTLEVLLHSAEPSLDTTLRLHSLRALAALAFRDGDPVLARSCLEQVRAIAEESGDRRLLATALREQGGILVEQLDFTEASRLLQESRDIQVEIDDEEGVAWVGIDLGMLNLGLNDYAKASAYFQDSLAMARRKDDQWRVAVIQYFQALIDLALGNVVAARAGLESSLRISLENDYRWFLPSIIEGFAAIAAQDADYAQAARLSGAADRLWESVAASPAPFWRAVVRRWTNTPRTMLSAEQFDELRNEGEAMTFDEVITCALGSARERSSETPGTAAVSPE